MNTKIAMFDTDTQIDFMTKTGKLYVKNSEIIIPNIKKLTYHSFENEIKIFGSVDTHFGTPEYKEAETELNINGGPFPMHCEYDKPGEDKILESRINETLNAIEKYYFWNTDVEYIESEKVNEDRLKYILNDGRQIIFEKQSYNVFWDENNPGGNKNINFALNYLNIDSFFVYGVCFDICVKAVVMGLLKRNYNVFIIMDAIYHLNEENKKSTIIEFFDKKVRFITTNDVINFIK